MQSKVPFHHVRIDLEYTNGFLVLRLREPTPYDGALPSIELTLCRRIIELIRAETVAEGMPCLMCRQLQFVSQGPLLARDWMTFCHHRLFDLPHATTLCPTNMIYRLRTAIPLAGHHCHCSCVRQWLVSVSPTQIPRLRRRRSRRRLVSTEPNVEHQIHQSSSRTIRCEVDPCPSSLCPHRKLRHLLKGSGPSDKPGRVLENQRRTRLTNDLPPSPPLLHTFAGHGAPYAPHSSPPYSRRHANNIQ